MLSKSIEQINLFSMDKYINDLIHLYDNKKLPNKIILSGESGIGKSVLAFHLLTIFFQKMKIIPMIKIILELMNQINHLILSKIILILTFIFLI